MNRVVHHFTLNNILNFGFRFMIVDKDLKHLSIKIFTQALVTHVPDIITTIISWTMDYLQEHVVNWIREQGGWVRNYPISQ